MTPEGKVKEKVKALLVRHGVWYFMPVSNGFGTHGIPDIVACVNGSFMGIECKAQDGMKPTELQQMQMDRIKAAGGAVFLATPGNIRDLEVRIVALKEGLTCC